MTLNVSLTPHSKNSFSRPLASGRFQIRQRVAAWRSASGRQQEAEREAGWRGFAANPEGTGHAVRGSLRNGFWSRLRTTCGHAGPTNPMTDRIRRYTSGSKQDIAALAGALPPEAGLAVAPPLRRECSKRRHGPSPPIPDRRDARPDGA